MTIGFVVSLMMMMTASVGTASAGTVDDDQALFLYQLNRARWDPVSYSEVSGISMDGVLPRPPLAHNSALALSAGFKANEMAINGYFAHQSAVTGSWPNEIAREHGYPLPGEFRDDANNIESLHGGSPIASNALESLAKSQSHRAHVFGEGAFFGAHREVGVGKSAVGNVWAVHSAYRAVPVVFVTGVVFEDANGNGRFDGGEGLDGVRVTAGTRTVRSSGGGQYAIPVSGGRQRIAASGGGFTGRSSTMVTVRDVNVGADFISGIRLPVVRDYQTCEGLEPTVLGTNRNDVLFGTSGRDVIHGLGGNDKIYGLGGDDIICGGDGDDLVFGGSGNDGISGGSGEDRIRGGTGNDELRGEAQADVLMGEVGADRLWGGSGFDVLVGGSGRDTIDGGSGEDECSIRDIRSSCE